MKTKYKNSDLVRKAKKGKTVIQDVKVNEITDFVIKPDWNVGFVLTVDNNLFVLDFTNTSFEIPIGFKFNEPAWEYIKHEVTKDDVVVMIDAKRQIKTQTTVYFHTTNKIAYIHYIEEELQVDFREGNIRPDEIHIKHMYTFSDEQKFVMIGSKEIMCYLEMYSVDYKKNIGVTLEKDILIDCSFHKINPFFGKKNFVDTYKYCRKYSETLEFEGDFFPDALKDCIIFVIILYFSGELYIDEQ